MIAQADWAPAIAAARATPPSRTERFDAAMLRMEGVIDAYFRESSQNPILSRRADGLSGIDAAARALRNGWRGWNGAGVASDAAVTAVFRACRAWLASRQICGMRITGWREPHIRPLYWRVAWCYSTDNYVRQAHATTAANNANGLVTLVTDPVAAIAPVGNPYGFLPISRYTHEAIPGRVVRGDTRSPETILNQGGFQPLHGADPWQYTPFFDGNAVGTISVSNDIPLAIQAGAAARALRNPIDPPSAWLAALMGTEPVRGYVYEFNIGAALTTRLDNAPTGLEHIVLSLPPATILQWWVVISGRRTMGPFPFPPVDPGPLAAAPNTSAANQLS